MPKVGKKKFAYTKKGKQAAAKYRKRKTQKAYTKRKTRKTASPQIIVE